MLNPAEPLNLTFFLQGWRSKKDTVVAIVEGQPFGRRIIPMVPDAKKHTLRTTVTLEPYFTGFATPNERALPVTVTFARLRGMKLIRFMTRTVYVTFGLPKEVGQLNTEPFQEELPNNTPPINVHTQSSPFVEAVEEQDPVIAERELFSNGGAKGEQAYWEKISHLITRSWTGLANAGGRVKGKGMVKVRFRLHANGEAQLIQVEKTSGTRGVDEAGLKAIVDAHPFPPFPSELPHEAVDMHVELSRTAKAVPHAVRPAPPRPSR